MTVTWAGTGFPWRVAGSYRYCLSAVMAALCKAGDPDSGFMDLICPEVSTSASNVTFSELFAAKSGNAFGEATARTDLISFGGTISVSSEGGMAETIAALLKGRGEERLSAMAATSRFSTTAESAPESGADLVSTAFSEHSGCGRLRGS